ncbi:hypothetical protein ACLEJW_09020 [Pseudomonas sp. SMSB3]|uniref:hypothetical protein n=1 Tax=Pseudomonas sp. SMSB3 TaxID=3390196 RepID=UPI003F830C4D
MPTENRSSNTEMVSVPPYIGLEPLVGRYYPAQCRRCGWVGSSEELTEEDAQCTRDVGDRLCLGDCDELERHDLLNIIQAMSARQPHPEPIAWMVGTAFWWTKEEAERDAADTGLPIVGLGPMAGVAPAEQHQGEPVALPARLPEHRIDSHGWNACLDEIAKLGPLYTRADPGEIERLAILLRQTQVKHAQERDALRAQLAECEAMAAMIAEREWAEHAGTGPVSSKVEAAFTQLHNDLHQAFEKITERDALLDRVVGHANFWHDHPYAEVVEAIAKDYKALSTNANSEVKS